MSRAGRKRRWTDRQPNGQPKRSRPKMRDDARSVALEARERVFSVSATVAASMPETSYLGRLVATGEISRRQYAAATEYQRVRETVAKHLEVPSYPKAGDLDRGGGYDASDGTDQRYVEMVESVKREAARIRSALFDISKTERNAPVAIEAIVMRGREIHALIGPLRVGLNAVANAVGLPREPSRIPG